MRIKKDNRVMQFQGTGAVRGKRRDAKADRPVSPKVAKTHAAKARACKVDLQNEIQRVRKKVKVLEADKMALEQRAAKLHQELAHQEKSVDHTRSQVKESRTHLQSAQSDLGEIGQTLQRRQGKLVRRLAAQLTHIRRQATGCTKKIDEVEHRIKQRIHRIQTEADLTPDRAVTPVIRRGKASFVEAGPVAQENTFVAHQAALARSTPPLPAEVVSMEGEAELNTWVKAQFQELIDVDGVEAEHIECVAQELEGEVLSLSASECSYHHAKNKVCSLKTRLGGLFEQLHQQTAKCALINNELKSVEAQMAEIEAEINFLNEMSERLRCEAEQAEKEAQIYEEMYQRAQEEARRLDAEAAQEAQTQAALDAEAHDAAYYEQLRLLYDDLLRLQEEVRSELEYAFYEGARLDANRAGDRAREIAQLIEQSQSQEMKITLREARDETQIDHVDARCDAIISYLKSLVGSSGAEGAASCSLPSGVCMTSGLASALGEIGQLQGLIDEVEDDCLDDIFAQSRHEARKSTIQAMLSGYVPEPRDIKILAVASNAPSEWVAQLDACARQLDDLALHTPKQGQLKGVVEQKKMVELKSFVDFLDGLGAENFMALLEGRMIKYESGELSDPKSDRRKHLDLVLDGLFCT